MKRNLDGCYFRVCREGKWQDICLSDMTHEERLEIMKGKDDKWFMSVCDHLADRIKHIGDHFDIIGVDINDN